MAVRLRQLAVPGFLLLCLLLGGSTQGVWRVMILQLLAAGLIAWAAATPRKEPSAGASRRLLLLIVFTLLLFLMQLVPLPPAIWTSLPGRESISSGYRMLGYAVPWQPLTVAPYVTLATFLTLLPPIAVIVGILRLGAYREDWMAGAILTGLMLGVVLGTLQAVGGPNPIAWWYLYENTNSGAIGFFANRNHMGTLLLVGIPFAIALFASGGAGGKSRKGSAQGRIVGGLGALAVVLVGIALNWSMATLLLALPVIVLSALLLPGHRRAHRIIFGAAAVLTLVGMAMYTSSPVQMELAGADSTSLETRRCMWAASWTAVSDAFPFGTGIGSFEQIFRTYENAAAVDPIYVNHAHNDYLELLVETGLAGGLLMAAFLGWWALQLFRIWKSPLSSRYSKAATIASGAILAHSIVDYPLRTAAIAAIFAACIALMARPHRQQEEKIGREARPARHLKIG